MDFTLTDEQRMIQQTARTLLHNECPLALVKSAWESPATATPLWETHLRDWIGLAEAPLADICLFVEELGRALAPGPYLPTLLAAYAARAVDEELEDSATIAVAGADGFWQPNEHAEKHFVPCAAAVQQIVVVAGSPARPSIALVAATDVVATEIEQFDRLRPQYRVRTDGAPAARRIEAPVWQCLVQRALVTVAAELIGVGRALLDSAVAYAKERQQFGRPIGSFQGLQWKLVDVALELERAAAAVAWAAMCVDAGSDDAALAVHCAKLEAGSAARRCARSSLQVHGGIGYTWEHGLHYWLRRAYAGDAFMGSADHHARCLADALFAAPIAAN